MATASKPKTTFGIPERYRDLAFCGLILLSVVIFFADALFTGKNFLSDGDNVAFLSFIPYLEQAKESGDFPLWMPYIFSGMPSLASFLAAGERSWDILGRALFALPQMFGALFNNDTARLAMWYTIYGWGVYALMRVKKQERLIATFSAIAAIFSTFVIIWIMIGHSTKPVSIACFPWILLALERIRERFTFLNLFLLILPFVALVSATHPQMMFYIGCGTALYLLVELISRLISKEGAAAVLRAAGCVIVAGLIGLATHADMLMAAREYTPHSTRGSAPLLQSQSNKQDESGGNDYEYATNWSFSPGEVMTFFVPNYYGFGNTKVKPVGSARAERQNLYWGQMPFTDAANYMGIGVLLLACMGAWAYRRDPFVQFLIALGLFSLFLSFGKNLSILYDVFYNLAPAFNKFRAPSMALVLLQFAVPVLAGYGLAAVKSWHAVATPRTKRNGLITLGVTGAFLLIGIVYTNASAEDYKADVASSFVEKGRVASVDRIPDTYTSLVQAEMQSDWIATGFIAVLFGLIIFLVARRTIRPDVAITIMLLLMVVDLWRVGKRGYEPKKGSYEQNVFKRTDVVDYVKQDNGVFRVADLTGNPANWWAYFFVENVHGYSSAKLRVYQDMLDIAALGPLAKDEDPQKRAGNSNIGNQLVWNMLGVKYIITDRAAQAQPTFSSSSGAFVYKNTTALPRAWFVDSVRVEPNGRTILENMRDQTFDPSVTAFVEKPISGTFAADSAASATVVGKSNQLLALKTTSTQSGFMVVGEVFYPEWHAYIDGKEVEIHKTNYLLRGVVVPAGTHTVEFRFASPAFENGRTISIAANGLALLIGALGLFFFWKGRKQGAIA